MSTTVDEYKNYLEIFKTFTQMENIEDLEVIFTKNPNCEANMEKLMKTPKFVEHIKTMDHKNLKLTKIEVRDIYMFGPNIGFALINNTIYNRKSNLLLPGAVFIRGGAVAILVIVVCEGRKYVLLTRQYRVPMGSAIVEAVAGMLDDDRDVNGKPDPYGVAIKELKEESGLELKRADLIKVGRMYPSGGGCDEFIECFYTKNLDISNDKLDYLQTHVFGEGDESIRIEAHPINTQKEVFQLLRLNGSSVTYSDSKINACLLGYIENHFNLVSKD
jgi:8-oxo-dGTP pyrophosphatase MutT (NUDIX family)